jgi:hypothetical protein
MKQLSTSNSIVAKSRRLLSSSLGAAVLLVSGAAAAEEPGWSFNFTPVLVLPKDDYRLGGGSDPELRHAWELGPVSLSAGGRVGAYYAKNLFGVTVMPTLRATLPLGPVEPYLAGGVGYGWLPTVEREGLATMARFGTVFHFSDSFSIGLEATLQQIHGTNFEFPSFGSMMSIDL